MNENFFDISNQEEIAETKRFFVRVYGWMSLALIITGLTAFKTFSSEQLLSFVYQTPFVFTGLLIAEIKIMVSQIKKGPSNEISQNN